MLHDELLQGVATALIDTTIESKTELQPRFITNNRQLGTSLLAELTTGLRTCTAFCWAIAFISKSGISALKQELYDARLRGIQGKLLTTDYLYFNHPDIYRELAKFDNLEVRIYRQENFHIKGYLFYHDDYTDVVIGSGNLTQTALKVNQEWNMKFTTLDKGAVAKQVNAEFTTLWNQATVYSEAWLLEYEQIYIDTHKRILPMSGDADSTNELKPNQMQQKALAGLQQLYSNKQHKALLVSATGTGKTYLSALAVDLAKAHKVLFIAHREQLLTQATEVFSKILQPFMSQHNLTAGILSGRAKEVVADYLFSTVNMLSKDEILSTFAPNHFEYIIIDEAHRIGSDSYQKILNYFQPKFLLGMTATPERTDGYNIYRDFDHNIAYEIRLQDAMEADLLCPFHYFGITDLIINGNSIDDKTQFSTLINDDRVEHIISKLAFYGYSGNRVRGLIFCRSLEEARVLSSSFNQRGFATVALSGNDTYTYREECIERLRQRNRQNGLDYIFTVDIFNEGIDIPEINQIILLRPTKSPIVFVQQLGRGLRKAPDKEYVVILDFIANYQNNFMIPIALSGDRSYNRDTLRRYVAEGSRYLPGASTLNFDTIAREAVYHSIDTARLTDTALLKQQYYDLKDKLGRCPELADFKMHSTIDIVKYWDKFGSYYNFLAKYDSDYTIRFTEIAIEQLAYICQRFAKGKRKYELLVLHYLLQGHETLTNWADYYNLQLDKLTEQSIYRNLTNLFTISNERDKYQHCIFLEPTISQTLSTASISQLFAGELKVIAYRDYLQRLIEHALWRFTAYYSHPYNDTDLVLYKKYTYEEVCYLLNWPQKINPNAMAGYFYEKTTRTMPIFINYIPATDKRVNYTNELLGDSYITAYSKPKRTLNSPDAQHIYRAKEEGNRLFLFMRKPSKEKEAKEFYFMGAIEPVGTAEEAPEFNGFKITYHLLQPIRADLYDYFINS